MDQPIQGEGNEHQARAGAVGSKADVWLASGKPSGFTVERLNANRDGFDLLDRGRVFKTEELARAAIAKATGR